MYPVAREAVEAWATVEQDDKVRRLQSRRKVAVTRVSRTKEEKGAVVSARSGNSKSRGSCRNVDTARDVSPLLPSTRG